jgi:hypothetical protein
MKRVQARGDGSGHSWRLPIAGAEAADLLTNAVPSWQSLECCLVDLDEDSLIYYLHRTGVEMVGYHGCVSQAVCKIQGYECVARTRRSKSSLETRSSVVA